MYYIYIIIITNVWDTVREEVKDIVETLHLWCVKFSSLTPVLLNPLDGLNKSTLHLSLGVQMTSGKGSRIDVV